MKSPIMKRLDDASVIVLFVLGALAFIILLFIVTWIIQP